MLGIVYALEETNTIASKAQNVKCDQKRSSIEQELFYWQPELYD